MIGKASDKGLRLVTKEFTLCLREMERALRGRASHADITDHEVARILEAASRRTGDADRSKIREFVSKRTVFRIDGKKWRTRDWKTGKDWRVPDAIWSEMRNQRQRQLTRKLAAVGITRRSWKDITDKMGQQISVPGFVASASVSVPTSQNTDTGRTVTTRSFIRMIKNKHPLLNVPATEGIQAFFSAVGGRVRFFHENLKRGVFSDIDAVARKYPGMKVKF